MSTLREQLAEYENQELLEQLTRIAPRTYDEFIEVLYGDLDFIIGLIESDSKDFGESLEDELNREVVRLLRARFHVASHDHDEGGHVDVRVTSRNQKFSWLAEAKIDKGSSYLHSGVTQLTDRYARGTPDHNYGGLIVYVQRARCAERFANWRDYISKCANEFEMLSIEDSPTRSSLAFYSSFVLSRIGTGAPPYKIRHVAVSAYRQANAALAAPENGTTSQPASD